MNRESGGKENGAYGKFAADEKGIGNRAESRKKRKERGGRETVGMRRAKRVGKGLCSLCSNPLGS